MEETLKEYEVKFEPMIIEAVDEEEAELKAVQQVEVGNLRVNSVEPL